MSEFRFFKYQVYKDLQTLTVDFSKIFMKLNSTQNQNIKWQLERALLSIRLNIVEGSSRKSRKEFAHFLEISLGSLFEVVACIDYTNELIGVDIEVYQRIIKKLEKIGCQIMGLIKHARRIT